MPEFTDSSKQLASSTVKEAPTKPGDHRTRIIARLRDQEIHVPDVHYIYTDWAAKVHPDVLVLRQHLEGYFQTFISTESQRKKQRRVDNGLCAGYFWTHVEPEKFVILGELVAWVTWPNSLSRLSTNVNCSSFSGMTRSIAVL